MSIHSAPGELNLHYWLANEDWYPSKFTQDFLARTPAAEANDALEEISRDADLEKLTPWSLFTLAFAMAGFTMSFGPAGPSINDRKAGIRATLLLGQRGDFRAIAPLVRLWSKGGLLSSKYQEEIEQLLITLLRDASTSQSTKLASLPLTDLAGRVWRARPLRRDLSLSQADLLLATLHYLQSQGEMIRQAIQTVTAMPAQGENRQRVQEAARSLPEKSSPRH